MASRVIFVLSGILALIAPPQGAPSSLGGYLLRVVLVMAFALVLVAVAGLHAAQSQSRRYGWPELRLDDVVTFRDDSTANSPTTAA